MIRTFQGITPRIAATAFVDESAQVIGDVEIGEHSSIWMNAVLRGDVHYIRIGNYTNIQDNAVVHVEEGRYPTLLGDRIVVGHGVLLHGCRIGNDCLISMGSIVLNDAEIGAGSIVAAGAVVPEHAVIPPGSLVMGVPGKVRRQVTEEERQRIAHGWDSYYRLKDKYLKSSGQ
jgi:carbonic anhydrase/acetyltransferase-like protein (isoleucine patch superfamily)